MPQSNRGTALSEINSETVAKSLKSAVYTENLDVRIPEFEIRSKFNLETLLKEAGVQKDNLQKISESLTTEQNGKVKLLHSSRVEIGWKGSLGYSAVYQARNS